MTAAPRFSPFLEECRALAAGLRPKCYRPSSRKEPTDDSFAAFNQDPFHDDGEKPG